MSLMRFEQLKGE